MNRPARTHRRRRRSVAALVATGLCGVIASSFAAFALDESNGIAPPLLARFVNSPEIDESSGIARSQHTANRFWTHNDSGDSARLFAIDSGQTEARSYILNGIQATDWEDITSGEIAGKDWIIVGDVGDNGKRRSSVFVYAFPESAAEATRGEVSANEIRIIEVVYPDGPGDCEAIAVDRQKRRLLLVKKTFLPLAGVYSVSLDSLAKPPPEVSGPGHQSSKTVRVEAERVLTLPIPMVTAMDIRHDGKALAITTYRDLFVYSRSDTQSWENALRGKPQQMVLPKLRQIEAVCYDQRGGLWVTSERSPMALFQVDLSQLSLIEAAESELEN